MGRLTAAARAALNRTSLGARYVCEIDFPSGTRYYSTVDEQATSLSRGWYQPRVKRWSPIELDASDRSLRVLTFQPSVVLDDTPPAKNQADTPLANMVASGELDRSYPAARIYLIPSDSTDFADWSLRFSGRLQSLTQTGEHEWTAQLGPDDFALVSPIELLRVTDYDWPNAPTASLNKVVPVPYGRHDSGGLTNSGALPTIHVDTVAHRYLFGFGWHSIDRVYGDGARLTNGGATAYSITHPTVNGRVFTLIDFVTGQGSAVITADGTGVEAVGDGTGALLTSPPDQLKHVLSNLVFSRNTSGVWSSDSSLVDVATFTAVKTFLSKRAGGVDYYGSMYIDGEQTAMEILDAFAESFQVNVIITRAGKVALAARDPNRVLPYTTDVHLRYPEHFDPKAPRPKVSRVTDGLVKRLTADAGELSADGSVPFSLEVFDPSVGVEATDSLDLQYAPAYR